MRIRITLEEPHVGRFRRYLKAENKRRKAVGEWELEPEDALFMLVVSGLDTAENQQYEEELDERRREARRAESQ